jgi:hypothetical protein
MASTLPTVQAPLPETDQRTPAAPSTSGPPAASQTPLKSASERKEILGRAIHTQVAQGARVESQGDYQAILVKGHPIEAVTSVSSSRATTSSPASPATSVSSSRPVVKLTA